MISAKAIGADAVAKGFALTAATADKKTAAVVRKWGLLLRTKVMGRASGRPGPRVVTGNYRRSITAEFGRQGGAHTAIVGTNAPQGRRLEYGFVGSDALGRHYNQPPFPHFNPAADEVEGPFTEEVARLAT